MADLIASGDMQMNYYYNTKALAQENGVEAVMDELEDWSSDAHYYDVWTEGPAQFEKENGFRPAAALDPQRRAYFKAHGFRFHRGGEVSYQEPPKV